MNKLRNGLLLLTLTAVLPLAAKQISPEEALGRVKAEAGTMAKIAAKQKPVLVHTELTDAGNPAVYIFNGANSRGYMVLSADDEAVPVLGYSDNGTFDTANMPPQMEWWLSEYARRIEYARANNITGGGMTRSISRSGMREAIAPQLKSRWDQGAPYNLLCPLDGTERTWTGCVATAMAQVMNYWQYPEKGNGEVTYTIASLEKRVTMNFSRQKFDWDDILDVYIDGNYSEKEANAVATLMKACGYGVKMQYSVEASGALAMNIANAMKKYFDYDPNITYTLRNYYSTAQWEDMMYENLKNVGPVIYGGGSMLGGGHSFVCDGYDGEGLFHFNWGWSGMSDGYFALDALNPDALGTGGGTGGGYNFTQDAVFGICPPSGAPAEERPIYLTQSGALKGTVTDNVLGLSLVNTGDPILANYNPSSLIFKFGAMFEPQGATPGEAVYHDICDARLSLEAGYGVSFNLMEPSVDLTELNLSNGTYKVVLGSVVLPKNTESSATDGEGFQAVRPYYGMSNSVTLTVNDGNYSVSNDLLPDLKISASIVGNYYFSCLLRVKVTVENTSDVDRVSGFAPIFMDSAGPLLIGESVFLSIPAHSTVEREWSTSMAQLVQYFDAYLDKPLTFTFYNEATYEFYDKSFSKVMTISTPPNTPQVTVQGLTVVGSHKENGYVVIPDASNIEVSANLTLRSGYFAYPVVACLCVPFDDQAVDIVLTASQNTFMSTSTAESSKSDFHVTLSYPIYDPNQEYLLVLAYAGATSLNPISAPLFVKFPGQSTGIVSTETDVDFSIESDPASHTVTVTAPSTLASVEAYDLTGRKAASLVSYDDNRATITLSQKGLTIVRATDITGAVKVFKVN